MRQAILLGRKHGTKALGVIHGPEVPIATQLDSYNALKSVHQNGKLVGETYAEIQLWERHDAVNALTFSKPETSKPKK